MASLSAEQAKVEALARFQAPAPEHINCGQAVLCYALLRLDEDPEAHHAGQVFRGRHRRHGRDLRGIERGRARAGSARRALAERGIEQPQTTADQLKAVLRDFTD